MNRPSEIMWVHIIRLLSIVAVVWVHSTAEIFFYDAPFGSFNWWVADVYDSLARICVPLLFMISGHLLLGKSEPVSDFLKKRAIKVVIPLFAWSLLYILWVDSWEYAHPSSASSMTADWLQKLHDAGWLAVIGMLWNPMYYHLWFLYSLLGLYLMTPVLRVFVQHAEPQALRYFVVLLIVAAPLLLAIDQAAGREGLSQPNLIVGSILYFVLGYLLGRITISKKLVGLMAVLVSASAAITVVGVYYTTAADYGELNQAMWWHTMPNLIAMSIGAFILLRYAGENSRLARPGKAADIVKRLSGASFGIYLVHPLFLYAFGEGLFGFRLTSVSGNPAVFVPIVVLAAFAASYVVIRIIQKIPVLRQIVP